MERNRLLIVGSDLDETVADCYRRTLNRHYEVEVCNPFDSATWLATYVGRVTYERINNLAKMAAWVASREQIGHALKRIARAAKEFAPDIVLVTCVDVVPPATVDALRAHSSTKIIGVFSDAVSNFGRGYFFAAAYDGLFFKDHFIVDKLRAKLGWRHIFYLPQACDPARHRPVPLSSDDLERFGCEVTIAGNAHYFRAVMLEPVLQFRFKMWGAPPARWLKHRFFEGHTGKYVTGDDKCKAMLAASIVLNANHYAEIAGTNKRTFEVAGIGGFQLTDTPALADVFAPDEEVATFTTQEDMIEKIRYYLARPELRAQMAGRSQLRAHREHTYAHRWAAKLGALGIPLPAGFPIDPADLAVKAV